MKQQAAVGVGIKISDLKTLEDKFAFTLMLAVTTMRGLEGSSPFALSMESLGSTIFAILDDLDKKGIVDANKVKDIAKTKLSAAMKQAQADGVTDIIKSLEKQLREQEKSVQEN